MPIYEYICEACGETSEFWQSIKDDPETTCPKCGKDALKKQISLSAFHLKGSGWYVTDYGGKNGGNTAPSNGESKTSADDGKTGSKSDSPAAASSSDTKTPAKSASDSA